MVVLNEGFADALLAEHLSTEGFTEEAAIVREDARLEQQYAWKAGRFDLHGARE
jgi:hypothetical protein